VISNEADLARDLGVSLGTVRKAFALLGEMQMVMRIPGKGTTVVNQSENNSNHRFINTRDAEGQPVLGDLHVADARIVEATAEMAAVFECPVGSKVLRFLRTRTYRDRVFTTEVVHLPIVPGDDLTMAERAKALWYDYDITVEKTECICVSPADRTDAEELHVVPGTSLFRSTRLIYGYKGHVLEHRVGSIHLGEDLTFMIGPPDRRLTSRRAQSPF
jgi:GntR family transcriptional regulator